MSTEETTRSEPMTTTTIRLPESLWRDLRGEAGKRGLSANKYLESLIEQHLETLKAKAQQKPAE